MVKMRTIIIVAVILAVSIGVVSFNVSGEEHSDVFTPCRVFVVANSIDEMDLINERLEGMDLDLGERLKYVPYRSVVFKDPGLMNEVIHLEGVKGMIEETSVEISLTTSTRNVKAAPSSEYPPETAHDLGYSGKGLTIAILDGGVDNEHPMLHDSFVAGADFSMQESPFNPRDGSVDPDDIDGHGTGVASVAMGRGEYDTSSGRIGVAPGAGLIDLKMRKIGPQLEGPMAAAIEWCLDNKDTDWGNGYNGVDVISISAGLGNPDGPVHALITRCVEEGIPVISAATNSGAAFEDDADGPNYWSDDSIIVGGTDDLDTVDRSDDVFWPQSTWGPRSDDGDDDPYDELKPDISAPGSNINVAQGRDINNPAPVYGWTTVSGTSYATPHVSGTVALMLEANPDIRPSSNTNPIRTILHKTAEQRGEPYDTDLSQKYNVHYGYGILDSYKAVDMALTWADVNLPPVINEFSISPSSTTTGSTCTIQVEVSDPEEDILDFDLVPEEGRITGNYPTYSYLAPDEAGVYWISLKVTDTSGNMVEDEISIRVDEGVANRPPKIDSLTAEPDKIMFGKTSMITVDASDSDGDDLTYSWSSSSGSLSGSGDTMTLTAGNTIETITVSVIVEDPVGATDSADVKVRVAGEFVGNPPFIESVDLDPGIIRKGQTGLDVVLTVSVSSTDSTVISVSADLSNVNGGEDVLLMDDGRSYDKFASDGIFTVKLPVVKDLDVGTYKIEVTARDIDGRKTVSSIDLVVQARAQTMERTTDPVIEPGSILIIAGMVFAALIIVFIFVRVTKRTPR